MLKDRLKKPAPGEEHPRDVIREIYERVQKKFLEDEKEKGEKSPGEDILREKVLTETEELIRVKYPALRDKVNDLAEEVVLRLLKLGPIEGYLKDLSVNDIMIQGTGVVLKQHGGTNFIPGIFHDVDEVNKIIDRICSFRGKKVDMLNPFVNVVMQDGSRCHIIIPPVADRQYITIRKHTCADRQLSEYVEDETLTQEEADYFEYMLVEKRKNILVVGGTGSGKTTLVNSLCKLIPDYQIATTIEDTPELSLPQPHTRRLYTRESTGEGVPDITQAELLIESLRMNQDRIIVGEVRKPIAADQLLQALNTGHEGSLSTIHASSAEDGLARLEELVMVQTPGVELSVVKRQIARAINIVIFVRKKEKEGKILKREITQIMEILPRLDERGNYQMKIVRQKFDSEDTERTWSWDAKGKEDQCSQS